MWETSGKLCVIFALAVNLSSGYHIEAPGSISGSFSSSASSASSFSSASSSSFSGTVNGNLDSQHFGKLVDGLKNGAASAAIAGATAGAYSSGAGGGGCSGDCSGKGGSAVNQGTGGAYDAKYSATNENGNTDSNVIPSSSGSCESCKGPYPGPNGSIHDYKLVSEVKGNSIVPSPAVTVPNVHHSEPKFPEPAGSVFQSKPLSGPINPSAQSGSTVHSGTYAGSGIGYQATQKNQNTFAGVAIHKGSSLSPEFITKLPGAPGSIHDSISATGSHIATGTGAVSGIVYQSGSVQNTPKVPGVPGSIPATGSQATTSASTVGGTVYQSGSVYNKLPGAPGSIHDSIPATGSQATTGASAVGGTVYQSGSVYNTHTLPGAPGSIHDSIPATGSQAFGSHITTGPGAGSPTELTVVVNNIPSGHPLEGPACIWRPGSPPDGCGHAPEIVVPAPQPNLPSPVQPSGSNLGPVSKPDLHLFPGSSGSIHESKPAIAGLISNAGTHSSANAGAYSQTGSHQVTLPAVTGSVPIGKFPKPVAGSGSQIVSGSNVYQSGSTNTGSYSEYDLPNQGVYYINKDTPAHSISLDLQAPYQHPQSPSFSAQVPCNEGDKTCGVKPITEPLHATERTPSCIGDHCGGQAQPALPLVNIGSGTGSTPSGGASNHASTGASNTAGSGYTSTNHGIQITNYKPFPSANCVNGGSCAGEYPKPQCENGVCGQPITGYNEKPKPENNLNVQPYPSEGCFGGNCNQAQNGFTTGHVSIHNQGDSNVHSNQGGSFSLQPQPIGAPDDNQQPYQPNTPCQKNGFCGQTPGFGTGSLSVHGKETGFATSQVSVHKQDGSVYNIDNDKQNKPHQPESQQPTGFPDHNQNQKSNQPNNPCQKNGLCGQTPGFGSGQLLTPSQSSGFATGNVSIKKQDGSFYNIEEDKQNKPYQPENPLSTGFPVNNQNQNPQHSNTACQKNGLCGQTSGFGTANTLVHGQESGFATGQVSVHKQDGSVYNIENDEQNKPHQPESQQPTGFPDHNQNQKSNQPNTPCQKNGLCGQKPGFGSGQLLTPSQSSGFATGNVSIKKQDGSVYNIEGDTQIKAHQSESDSKFNTPCQKNGLCGQTPGFGTGQLMILGQVPQTPGFATGNVYVQKHNSAKVEVVEDGNLGTSGQFENQGSSGFESGPNFGEQGSQQFGGNGFATGQVSLHKSDGSVNDITNSGCSSGTCRGSQTSGSSYGGSGAGSASYGNGGSYSSEQKYGCLSGSCANGGSNAQRGSYGTGSGSYSGSAGSYSSGQKYESNFQPYGALAGAKVHGGGSYAHSGAFASAGSFGGPMSQSLGLSRLTDGSSGHSGAVAGSYAGASAGSYASASSFAHSY